MPDGSSCTASSPSCLFTDPQVAHIGLTETEAGRQGIAVRVVKLPMLAVLRTRTIDEIRGFMKALIETDGDRILGFTMIGPEAGEVMAIVQMAMLAGLPYTALRDAILTHPTMAEGLVFFFPALSRRTPGQPIGTLTCSRARPHQAFVEYEANAVITA